MSSQPPILPPGQPDPDAYDGEDWDTPPEPVASAPVATAPTRNPLGNLRWRVNAKPGSKDGVDFWLVRADRCQYDTNALVFVTDVKELGPVTVAVFFYGQVGRVAIVDGNGHAPNVETIMLPVKEQTPREVKPPPVPRSHTLLFEILNDPTVAADESSIRRAFRDRYEASSEATRKALGRVLDTFTHNGWIVEKGGEYALTDKGRKAFETRTDKAAD